MRGSTNKSPTKLICSGNKVDTMICLWMEKTSKAKTTPGDFKVTTLENSLLSQQTVISKGIPVPYTNLQLNPYLNTQLDLFYSDNLSFQCMASSMWLTNWCMDPSMWLAHQLEKDVGYKVLPFIQMMKIMKLLGHKTLRRTNAAVSSRERWTRANCLRSQYAWIKPFHQVWRPLK